MQIGKMQTGKPQTENKNRTNTQRQIQIGKQTGRKVYIGKRKLGKSKSEITHRQQYCKIPIEKHKSENNNSEHTNRKIQIGRIQIGEY